MIDLDFYMEENPDFNPSDDRQATQRLFDRQTALNRWTSGEITEDEFLQLIEGLQVSPDKYVEAVKGQLLESGLWVP